MALTCPYCEMARVNCTCNIVDKKVNMYPHKGMTPVKVSNPIDRRWRQIRDKANKNIAFRRALVEFDRRVLDRAKEIEAEMVEMMTLGELHPTTHNCMD